MKQQVVVNEADVLSLLKMEYTYSESTFKRRFNLLTKNERKKVLSKTSKIFELLSQIDDIVCKRADLENDSWE